MKGKEARLLYLKHLKEQKEKSNKRVETTNSTPKTKTKQSLRQINTTKDKAEPLKNEALCCITINANALIVEYDTDKIYIWYKGVKFKITIEECKGKAIKNDL